MRAGLSQQESQASFMRDKLAVYDGFIELLTSLHQKDPSKGYDRRALEVFERKQGRAFLEQMGRSGARHFAGLPEAIACREAELEAQLQELQSLRSTQNSIAGDKGSPGASRTTLDRIQQVRAALTVLQDEIRVNYPDYHALKYPRPATISELQQSVLKPGEAFLVYGVMEKETCLWVIDREDFALFPIPLGEKGLQEKVHAFRSGFLRQPDPLPEKAPKGRSIKRVKPESAAIELAQSPLAEMLGPGRELYEILFPSGAREKIAKAKTLYIVPTGPLYLLPFEALTTGESRFLVEERSVAYLSSASLLKILRDAESRKKEKAKNPLLAFANPVYGAQRPAPTTKPGPGDGVKPEPAQEITRIADLRTAAYRDFLGGSFLELPDTEDEAKKIKAILQAPDQSRPLQLRDAASRSNVLRLNDEKKLNDYRFVVFACHGVLPGEINQVTQPALVLSHPDPQTGQEGFLTMADVFGLKLNADLVTLSACNTGRGEMQAGEGVVGLARAFMYAGSPALSVTLWSVESKSATLLSTGLHKGLKEGKSRAEALREAKLRLIRGEAGPFYHHPFLWAPVVIFGDGQ
jgi:CHAT domain-containing protein